MTGPLATLILLLVSSLSVTGQAVEDPPDGKPVVEKPAPAESEPGTGAADEPEAPVVDPEAPAVPASSPEALELLDKAIAHQGAEPVSKKGAVRDLTVRLQAEVWDYSKEEPTKLSIGVNRFLRMEPEGFRTEWKTNVDTETYGFDGKRYWYQNKEGASFLFGDPYKRDRQRIRAEIDETRYMLQFFFLANLKTETALFTLAGDEKLETWGKVRDCRILRRVSATEGGKEPSLTLWLDRKTGLLHKAVAHARTTKDKTLIFLFRYSELVQPRVNGVLFPFKIEIRELLSGAEKDRRASVATLLENGGIEINTGLKSELFQRPK